MNDEQQSIYFKRANQIVDILKGVAIWMVVVCLFAQSISINYYIELLANAMQLGCQIFFTLSCFTLCLSYSKTKLSYWQYFKKRVLKLVLPWFIMIFLGIIWRYLNYNTIEAINFKGVIINALFLNGLIPDALIHNSIVRGGWFIGTLFILYLLFPLLYKIFDNKNEKWQKCRHVVFPLSVISFSAIILAIINVTFNGFGNYPFFVYTNFINQICAFIIGFTLFHLYKTLKIKTVKLPLLKAILFAITSLALYIFVPKTQYVIVMVTVALATLYTVCFLFNNAFIKDNLDSELILRFFAKSGKISLGIYYTHSYLVWELTKFIIKQIFKLEPNPHFIVKICISLVIFILVYWVGKLFTFLINLIQTPLLKKFNVK